MKVLSFFLLCNLLSYGFAFKLQIEENPISQNKIFFKPDCLSIFKSIDDKYLSGENIFIRYEENINVQNVEVLKNPDNLSYCLNYAEEKITLLSFKTNKNVGEFSLTFKSMYYTSEVINETINSIYICSTGEFDYVSYNSLDEAREKLYFDNYVSRKKSDFYETGDENCNSEESGNGETIPSFNDYVFESENDISMMYASYKSFFNNKICVNVHVDWVDENNRSHPLKNNILSIKAGGDCLRGQLDDEGNFSEMIGEVPYNEVNTGRYLNCLLYAENDAVCVGSTIAGSYWYETGAVINAFNNDLINIRIVIRPGKSNRANAFEISQAQLIPYRYFNKISGRNIPEVSIIYPFKIPNVSCYVNNYIYIEEYDYYDWDVLNHEYGHYICDYFDICDTVWKEHRTGEDLALNFGKSKGLKLAYSEGLATYFSLASQMYFSTEFCNIPRVCDEKYEDLNKDLIPRVLVDYSKELYGSKNKTHRFGEGVEDSITSLLIKLLDNVSRPYDTVHLTDKQMWDVISLKERTHISSLINDLLESYPHLKNEIAILLEAERFSDSLNNNFTYLSTNPTFNCWDFSWNINSNGVAKPNKFDLIFYGTDNFYKIENIRNNSYSLNDYQKNEILHLNGDVIDWQVISYNDDDFLTGGYPSSILTIDKPSSTNIFMGTHASEYFSTYEKTKWYKFKASSTSKYTFTSSSTSLDLDCALLDNMYVENSEISNHYLSYDDNNGEGKNFKLNQELSKGEIVYIKVSKKSGTNGYFDFSINCNHFHNYNYGFEKLNILKHKRICECGDYITEYHDKNGGILFIGPKRYVLCSCCGTQILDDSTLIPISR